MLGAAPATRWLPSTGCARCSSRSARPCRPVGSTSSTPSTTTRGVRRVARDRAAAPADPARSRPLPGGVVRMTATPSPDHRPPGPRPAHPARRVRRVPVRGRRRRRVGGGPAHRARRVLVHLGEHRPAAGVVLDRHLELTWPPLREAEHLGISVLADHHDEVCRQLAGPREQRFDGLPFTSPATARCSSTRPSRPTTAPYTRRSRPATTSSCCSSCTRSAPGTASTRWCSTAPPSPSCTATTSTPPASTAGSTAPRSTGVPASRLGDRSRDDAEDAA